MGSSNSIGTQVLDSLIRELGALSNSNHTRDLERELEGVSDITPQKAR
jgi:hypothetical protein